MVGVEVRGCGKVRISLGMALLGLDQGKAHLSLYIDSRIHTVASSNVSFDPAVLVADWYLRRSGSCLSQGFRFLWQSHKSRGEVHSPPRQCPSSLVTRQATYAGAVRTSDQ